MASQKAFIVWEGSFHDSILPVTLTLTDGETIDLHFDESRWLPGDTLMQVMELRESIDISAVESVTMGDVTYPIAGD